MLIAPIGIAEQTKFGLGCPQTRRGVPKVRVKAGEYTARAEKMVAEVEAEYTRASNNALDVSF